MLEIGERFTPYFHTDFCKTDRLKLLRSSIEFV